MNKPYLSAEEQYKEILNNEEIERIQDTELQEIRRKYCFGTIRIHKANIPY